MSCYLTETTQSPSFRLRWIPLKPSRWTPVAISSPAEISTSAELNGICWKQTPDAGGILSLPAEPNFSHDSAGSTPTFRRSAHRSSNPWHLVYVGDTSCFVLGLESRRRVGERPSSYNLQVVRWPSICHPVFGHIKPDLVLRSESIWHPDLAIINWIFFINPDLTKCIKHNC